jgi:flagellar basal-body rod protein FlgF
VNLGIYNGVASANASQRRLEAITANIANVNTPAYKRVSTALKAFRLPNGSETDTQVLVHSETDFSQGDLQASASPYHMALMGEGFFSIDTPEGEMYSRRGDFHVNKDGVLLTSEDYPVAWEARPDPIDPAGEPITVDPTGEVRQGKKLLGSIKVVSVAQPGNLEPKGGGYFKASAGSIESVSDAAIYQSHLEGSNVTSIDELVGMISAQRKFEGAKSAMQMIDQSYGRLMANR